jgi:rubrerythrin
LKFESKSQLLAAIRRDIMGELEAINQYDAHIQATDDPLAKAVWQSIRDEERVHVGELLTLLTIFDPTEVEMLSKGEEEVKEIARTLGYIKN